MEFAINRDIFLKSLSHAYGIIEKKTTLPILSNILLEAKDSKIRITATDLDIIYSEEITLKELKSRRFNYNFSWYTIRYITKIRTKCKCRTFFTKRKQIKIDFWQF